MNTVKKAPRVRPELIDLFSATELCPGFDEVVNGLRPTFSLWKRSKVEPVRFTA